MGACCSPNIVPDESDVAVVVSDLTGLTKTTRKFGILQTASNIARMRQLALPSLKRLGMIDYDTEGDNLIMTFADLPSAAQAAYECQQRWKQYDEELPAGREHFKIRPSGFAVAWGPARRKGNHMVGRGFQTSYKLAEDEASGGQILVGPVVQKMITEDLLPGAAWKAVEGGDLLELVPSTGMKETFAQQGPAPAFDDDRFLDPNLMLLAKRHDPQANLPAIDADLRSRFMHQGMAAIMYRLDESAPHSEKEKAHQVVHDCFWKAPGVIKYEDINVEPQRDLNFFDTGGSALKAVMAASQLAGSIVNGWGIHTGEVLLMPNTDVHWGDPVNTASKIGQDLADPGEILISDEVCLGLPRDIAGAYDLQSKAIATSGVDFKVWRVQHR